MNKKRIDQNIAPAYEVLSEVGIAKNGKVAKAYRGQISSFGASISVGNLLSSIAFFSDNGGAAVERTKLLDAIFCLVQKNHANVQEKDLFSYVKMRCGSVSATTKMKEEITDYAIAIKLAMNLYTLTEA